MKKLIAFLFAAAMVLTVACKGKDAGAAAPATNAAAPAAPAADTSAPAADTAATN